MSKSGPKLPPSIVQANQVLAAQTRAGTGMMGGMAAMMILMFVSAFADFEPGVMVGVLGIITWALGIGALMARNSVAIKRATDIKKAWDQRQIMRELDAADPEPRAAADPEDPRWLAVSTLLARMAGMGLDEHTGEVIAAVEDRLRLLLTDMAAIDEAVAADAALGGDGSARQERLLSARYTKEKTADRLIDCVRDLHVELAVRDSDKADPILNLLESLVLQVEAEAEVEGASTPADGHSETRGAVARAQAFRRARQSQRES